MLNDLNIHELYSNGIIKFRLEKDIAHLKNEYLNEINNCLISQQKNFRSLGGFIAGHLNFYESKVTKKIYHELINEELLICIKKYLNTSFLNIRANSNLNFPNSSFQHWHFDGQYENNFLILNIPIIPITNTNGPTQIYLKSHRNILNLRHFLKKYNKSMITSLHINENECVLRDSRLWHRGTTNKSDDVRPMLAIIFEKTNNCQDLLDIPDENLCFIYSNMYTSSFIGKVKEYLFVYLPIINYLNRIIFKSY